MEKKSKKYEGKKYKFKKNSIIKAKNKYKITFEYVLTKILRYKKYINSFNKAIYYQDEQNKFDSKLINAMESIGKEFNINNEKIYSYNKFSKTLKKILYKELKNEKKKNIKSKYKIIKLYKEIENKNYCELRKLSIEKPFDFLKVICLYTIYED